jgi:myo-inositol-1(or 4)-monophosphatase
LTARRSALINVMCDAARKASRGLVRDFGEVEHLQVSVKGPADYVTEADRRAERMLKAELQKARPEFGFLMEEAGASAGTDASQRWIVDPLDATTNFLHSIPHFCISIALEREGELVAGVVHDPLRDESYWAEKGIGAYVNDRRLRVSARRNLGDALLATGIPFGARPGKEAFVAALRRAMETTAGVRRFGSAALDLAYVAAGRFDGFWETGLSPWDVAAGIVLVREAGGFVTDLKGGEDMLHGESILAANPALHATLARMFAEAMGAPAPAIRG